MVDNDKKANLRDALIKGISEVSGIIKEIEKGLVECANLFRIEQSERVFNLFIEKIENLNFLFEFIRQLKLGINNLNDPNLSLEPLLCWDKANAILKEMVSSFENKDWITLSDLIQYELNPILSEGEEKLSKVMEGLQYHKS